MAHRSAGHYCFPGLAQVPAEMIVDPGESVVTERLAGPGGVLSDDCNSAIRRWYGSL